MSLVAKKTIIALVGAFALMLIGVYINTSINTQAQENGENGTMRSFLESLNANIEAQPGFQVSITFAIPLTDGEDTKWTLPYTSEDGEIQRIFGVIGDDFVCFYEIAGSLPVGRCTPYSNIVAVSWFGDI